MSITNLRIVSHPYAGDEISEAINYAFDYRKKYFRVEWDSFLTTNVSRIDLCWSNHKGISNSIEIENKKRTVYDIPISDFSQGDDIFVELQILYTDGIRISVDSQDNGKYFISTALKKEDFFTGPEHLGWNNFLYIVRKKEHRQKLIVTWNNQNTEFLTEELAKEVSQVFKLGLVPSFVISNGFESLPFRVNHIYSTDPFKFINAYSFLGKYVIIEADQSGEPDFEVGVCFSPNASDLKGSIPKGEERFVEKRQPDSCETPITLQTIVPESYYYRFYVKDYTGKKIYCDDKEIYQMGPLPKFLEVWNGENRDDQYYYNKLCFTLEKHESYDKIKKISLKLKENINEDSLFFTQGDLVDYTISENSNSYIININLPKNLYPNGKYIFTFYLGYKSFNKILYSIECDLSTYRTPRIRIPEINLSNGTLSTSELHPYTVKDSNPVGELQSSYYMNVTNFLVDGETLDSLKDKYYINPEDFLIKIVTNKGESFYPLVPSILDINNIEEKLTYLKKVIILDGDYAKINLRNSIFDELLKRQEYQNLNSDIKVDIYLIINNRLGLKKEIKINNFNSTVSTKIIFKEKMEDIKVNLYGGSFSSISITDFNYPEEKFLKEGVQITGNVSIKSYNGAPEMQLFIYRDYEKKWQPYSGRFSLVKQDPPEAIPLRNKPILYSLSNTKFMKIQEILYSDSFTKDYKVHFKMVFSSDGISSESDSIPFQPTLPTRRHSLGILNLTDLNIENKNLKGEITINDLGLDLNQYSVAKIKLLIQCKQLKDSDYVTLIDENHNELDLTKDIDINKIGLTQNFTVQDFSKYIPSLSKDWTTLSFRLLMVTSDSLALGAEEVLTQKSSYSNQSLVYNLVPTLSWRRNKLGINTMELNNNDYSMATLAISQLAEKKLLVLEGINNNKQKFSTINLENGDIDGFNVNGGTWDIKAGTMKEDKYYEYCYGGEWSPNENKWLQKDKQYGWGARLKPDFLNKRVDESPLSSIDGQNVTNISYLFYNYNYQENGYSLKCIINSPITQMKSCFENCHTTSLQFEGNLKQTLNMESAFKDLTLDTKLKNNLSFNCTTTDHLVSAKNLFQNTNCDILNINFLKTFGVVDFSNFFYGCKASQLTFSNTLFNTSNAINMNNMFRESSFKHLDLSNFDTAKVTTMSYMFSKAKFLTLGQAFTFSEKITNLENMFEESAVDFLHLRNLDIKPTMNYNNFFLNSTTSVAEVQNKDTADLLSVQKPNNLVIVYPGKKELQGFYEYHYGQKWDGSKWTTVEGLYGWSAKARSKEELSPEDKEKEQLEGITSFPLATLHTLPILSLDYAFYQNQSKRIMFEKVNTSKIISMKGMFCECKCEALDISKFDFSNVLDASYMFSHCNSNNIFFGNLKLKDSINLKNMLEGITNLPVIDFSGITFSGKNCILDNFCDGLVGPDDSSGIGIALASSEVDAVLLNAQLPAGLPFKFKFLGNQLKQGFVVKDGTYEYHFKQSYYTDNMEDTWTSIDENGWGIHYEPLKTESSIRKKPLVCLNGYDIVCYNYAFSRLTIPIDFSLFDTSRVISMMLLVYASFDFPESIPSLNLDFSLCDFSKLENCTSMFAFAGKKLNITFPKKKFYNVKQMLGMFFYSPIESLKNFNSFASTKLEDLYGTFAYSAFLNVQNPIVFTQNVDTSNVHTFEDMFAETNNIDPNPGKHIIDISSIYLNEKLLTEPNSAKIISDTNKYPPKDFRTFLVAHQSIIDFLFTTVGATNKGGIINSHLDVGGECTLGTPYYDDLYEYRYNQYWSGDRWIDNLEQNGWGFKAKSVSTTVFSHAPFSTLKKRPVVNARNAFNNSSITSIDFSGFDTSNIIDMHGMFANCHHLENLNLSFFDTYNVTDMSSMFERCESLIHINLSNFDTEKVKYMWGMFSYCWSLAELDLKSFDFTLAANYNNLENMFYQAGANRGMEGLIVNGYVAPGQLQYVNEPGYIYWQEKDPETETIYIDDYYKYNYNCIFIGDTNQEMWEISPKLNGWGVMLKNATSDQEILRGPKNILQGKEIKNISNLFAFCNSKIIDLTNFTMNDNITYDGIFRGCKANTVYVNSDSYSYLRDNSKTGAPDTLTVEVHY